jgi:hypothetical protein
MIGINAFKREICGQFSTGPSPLHRLGMAHHVVKSEVAALEGFKPSFDFFAFFVRKVEH